VTLAGAPSKGNFARRFEMPMRNECPAASVNLRAASADRAYIGFQRRIS
jgi:hypothetical protein